MFIIYSTGEQPRGGKATPVTAVGVPAGGTIQEEETGLSEVSPLLPYGWLWSLTNLLPCSLLPCTSHTTLHLLLTCPNYPLPHFLFPLSTYPHLALPVLSWALPSAVLSTPRAPGMIARESHSHIKTVQGKRKYKYTRTETVQNYLFRNNVVQPVHHDSTWQWVTFCDLWKACCTTRTFAQLTAKIGPLDFFRFSQPKCKLQNNFVQPPTRHEAV